MSVIALEEPQSPARLSRQTDLEIEVTTSADALDGLRLDWEALEALSGASAVFQSFEMVRAWMRHFTTGSADGRRLHVAIIRRAGRAVLR